MRACTHVQRKTWHVAGYTCIGMYHSSIDTVHQLWQFSGSHTNSSTSSSTSPILGFHTCRYDGLADDAFEGEIASSRWDGYNVAFDQAWSLTIGKRSRWNPSQNGCGYSRISTYLLLSASYLTSQNDKCMHLLNRVYGKPKTSQLKVFPFQSKPSHSHSAASVSHLQHCHISLTMPAWSEKWIRLCRKLLIIKLAVSILYLSEC